jgi:hypothetical protein
MNYLSIVLLLVASLLAPAPAVRAGRIVLHDAFPAVLANYPERVQDGVDGYIATNSCEELGQTFVLVRPGVPDALVAVADCAWDYDIPYRQRMGYIADVDRRLWVGPERPQEAQLWPVGLRRVYLALQAREHELRPMGDGDRQPDGPQRPWVQPY